ncbi:MAG: hypothetical protein ACRC0X_04830 [Brevinema sp.]
MKRLVLVLSIFLLFGACKTAPDKNNTTPPGDNIVLPPGDNIVPPPDDNIVPPPDDNTVKLPDGVKGIDDPLFDQSLVDALAQIHFEQGLIQWQSISEYTDDNIDYKVVHNYFIGNNIFKYIEVTRENSVITKKIAREGNFSSLVKFIIKQGNHNVTSEMNAAGYTKIDIFTPITIRRWTKADPTWKDGSLFKTLFYLMKTNPTKQQMIELSLNDDEENEYKIQGTVENVLKNPEVYTKR